MGAHGLEDWDDVEGRWPTLLIGNGASIAVSQSFNYPSLYTVAPLYKHDRAIFDALDTKNFEEVLSHLRIAATVCEQLGHKHAEVKARYESIRRALIDAVRDHHVEWSEVASNDRLLMIRTALLDFDAVFSTNYDLIVYWAMMNAGNPPGEGFGDLFWNQHHEFDSLDTESFDNKTLVYWLHGGLHLYRTADGETRKRTNNGANLLATFASGGRVPLFVSEGTWREKRSAIRRSDYLEHAYNTFAATEGPLVIFGHGLGKADSHLIRAIRADPGRDIAYAVFPSSSTTVNLQRAQTANLFPQAKIRFFDSTTHPLGDPSLRVP